MAIETLRPNAGGDETALDIGGSSPAATNWESVDEVVADDAITYVLIDEASSTWFRDLYNIADSGVGSGTINNVTVYVRCLAQGTANNRLKIAVKPSDTAYESAEKNFTLSKTWEDFSQGWATNPDGGNWTWEQINALQVGINLYSNISQYCQCTQVYVEVDYTPITPKTSSDSGSGVDAKATGNPLATFPVRSETGGGVDGHKAVAPQSAGETGSGVDALTALLGILARSETGLGTDAKLSLAVALIKADAGSGVEHILDRVLVLISESGAGLDVSHLVKTLMLTETGTGVENSYLRIIEGVRSSADSGAGAETSSLAALFQRDETGEGVESVVARALYAREYPTGALDLAKVITAAITGVETGTGAEASLVSFYQKKADSGEGVDASTLVALFTGEDSGAGAEAITLLAAMVAHDTGVGVEAVIEFFRKLIDSGQGEENLHLIGYVGRAMKLITYLRAYSDLVTYTKPHSDLRVYTSEVKQ